MKSFTQFEMSINYLLIIIIAMKAQSVRLEPKTVEKLKDLEIEIQGVTLKTYQDKIDYLIWYLENQQKNK